MYNANMDAMDRLPDDAIRKQLSDWETILQQQQAPADLFGRNHEYDAGKALNLQRHYAKYKVEFDAMIEELKEQKADRFKAERETVERDKTIE
jgi:hypothetical protein